MMRLEIASGTHVGRVRESNEDALLCMGPLPSGDGKPPAWVLAVADGMGGHQAGEVASALAVQALAQEARDAAASGQVTTDWLSVAMLRANRAVWNAARDDRARQGMGTTLVAALVAGERVAVGNVGDSRCYRLGPDGVRQVTADHSWVAEQVGAGRMSRRDAETSPYRNVLTRSLGMAADVEVDLFAEPALHAGEALVLVSDGVSGYLTNGTLAALFGRARSAQALCDHLIKVALDGGGIDNATVVVVRGVE